MVAPIIATLIEPSPWAVFVPYSGLHLLSVSAAMAVVATAALVGRALRSKGAEAKLRCAIAVFAVYYFIAYNVWWNWKGIDVASSLPLQICDLNGVVAPLALWTRNRWARATLYFWAFALTLQAFIQPLLTAGPASPIFWAFWTGHTTVMVCAVYDVAVVGFRPDWRDLWRAISVSTLYFAVIMPVDLWLGANYGFIGNPAPAQRIPPFVAALGPWPRRVFILVALVALAFVLALAPWRLFKRLRPSSGTASAPD